LSHHVDQKEGRKGHLARPFSSFLTLALSRCPSRSLSVSFSPSKICLRSKRADRTSTPLSIPVPSTSPAGSDKQESKQLSTNSALTSNPNDLLLVSLNLYLFGLTLFTGPFKLFNLKSAS
jgi:hypothetical protein